jgi:hypothetical protein
VLWDLFGEMELHQAYLMAHLSSLHFIREKEGFFSKREDCGKDARALNFVQSSGESEKTLVKIPVKCGGQEH